MGLTKILRDHIKNSVVLLLNDFGLEDENKIFPSKTLCRIYP